MCPPESFRGGFLDPSLYPPLCVEFVLCVFFLVSEVSFSQKVDPPYSSRSRSDSWSRRVPSLPC